MELGQVEYIRTLLAEALRSSDSGQETGDAEIKDITAEGYKLMMAAPDLLEELLASHDYHLTREMTYFGALEEVQALVAAGEDTKSILQAIEEAWAKVRDLDKPSLPIEEGDEPVEPDPPGSLTWTYAELLVELKGDLDATKYPHVKLSIPWPDGSGESPWGRNLGHGLTLLANSPVYPKYRFHDIIDKDQNIVKRPLPTKIVYQYTPIEGGPLDGEKDVDLPRRAELSEAITGVQGAHSHFFAQGQGYVLCEPSTDLSAVQLAMFGTGHLVEPPKVQGFDEKAGEYNYTNIP
jgi:hypothetical protein